MCSAFAVPPRSQRCSASRLRSDGTQTQVHRHALTFFLSFPHRSESGRVLPTPPASPRGTMYPSTAPTPPSGGSRITQSLEVSPGRDGEDGLRRQSSVTEGETIRIVIHDVDIDHRKGECGGQAWRGARGGLEGCGRVEEVESGKGGKAVKGWQGGRK